MLTLAAIPISFDGDTHLRSDMVAAVLDNSGVPQPFVPADGATWTLTPGTGTYDAASDSTSYQVVLSGVPTTFVPGIVSFSFAGDGTIRATEWVSLSGLFVAALVLAQVVPPAPASGYPTAVDVSNALAAAGITVSGSADLTAAVVAAIADFERNVGRQMLSDGTYSTRAYNPPTNPNGSLMTADFLVLATGAGCLATATLSGDEVGAVAVNVGGKGYPNAPLVRVTGGDPAIPATITATATSGVVTGFTVINPGAGYQSPPIVSVMTGVGYQPYGEDLAEFVLGRDYGVEPAAAPDYGFPYERIDLFPTSRRWIQPIRSTLRNSLLVTAQWGFATAIPQAAFDAMVARALWRLTPSASQFGNKGILSWAHDGSEARMDPGFKNFAEGQDKIYLAGVAQYKKARWSQNGA